MKDFHKKESPLLGLTGTGGGLSYLAGGGILESLYVDDVFSSNVYTGTGSVRSIVNGVSLGNEVAVSLNGKTITDTAGIDPSGYDKLINDVVSSSNSDYYYGSIDCYIDYGSAVVSTFYDLAPQGDNRIGAVYNTPTSVTGYGSNNGSSWTSLGAVSYTAADWTEGQFTRYHFLSNTTAYRYYRLTVSGTKSLQEWRLGVTDSSLGQGGMVWIKQRSSTNSHSLFDTERGAGKYIKSDSADSEYTTSNALSVFNSDGFTLAGADGATNGNGGDYVSWSFRKCPGFFDVVTWDGNGTNGRIVSHNLGSVPGMIIIKSDSTSTYWIVYHRSLGEGQYMLLNDNVSKSTYDSGNTNSRYFNNTAPTSTSFTLSDDGWVNGTGRSYVAYIFAHDDQSFGTNGNESIVKCGSYTGTGSANPVDLGFEPQWLMVKRADAVDNWSMHDMMRGMALTQTQRLKADTDVAESTWGQPFAPPSPTGFIPTANNGEINTSGATYIYCAIRRPNKPITDPRKLFAIDTAGGNLPNPPLYKAGFRVDSQFRTDVNGGNRIWHSRLQDTSSMSLGGQAAESSASSLVWDYDDGWSSGSSVESNVYSYMFQRAPGFFDVVGYTGTGSAQNINHNLEAKPELIITKRRDDSGSWAVYAEPLTATDRLRINFDGGRSSISTYWNDTEPTSSVFTVGSDGNTGTSGTFIAYLFASLAGVSKIGTYSGNTSNNVDVNCGFSSSARFVLIKRTDTSGGWYIFDAKRGIVDGNDPYNFLNGINSAAQVTNTDYIDPLSTGFRITSTAPAGLNATGGTYLFLAIA